MQRAANDVMQSILFSAVLDGIAALKRASGGLPNQLLRDVQAIHPNVTFADLPKALQDAIAEEDSRRVHATAQGRLCGRPARADAPVAADGPRSRAPAPGSGDRRGPPRGPSQGHRRGGRPPKNGGMAEGSREVAARSAETDTVRPEPVEGLLF